MTGWASRWIDLIRISPTLSPSCPKFGFSSFCPPNFSSSGHILGFSLRHHGTPKRRMNGSAATFFLSVPIHAKRSRTKSSSLNSRACLNEYPLASRIIIKNLSYSTTEGTLRREFSNFGQIAEVKLGKDEATKTSKGFAFIQYTSPDDAILALENMDQEEFDGRMIHVELAKPVRSSFRGYPITSGPPKVQRFPEQQLDEVADCWY